MWGTQRVRAFVTFQSPVNRGRPSNDKFIADDWLKTRHAFQSPVNRGRPSNYAIRRNAPTSKGALTFQSPVNRGRPSNTLRWTSAGTIARGTDKFQSPVNRGRPSNVGNISIATEQVWRDQFQSPVNRGRPSNIVKQECAEITDIERFNPL